MDEQKKDSWWVVVVAWVICCIVSVVLIMVVMSGGLGFVSGIHDGCVGGKKWTFTQRIDYVLPHDLMYDFGHVLVKDSFFCDVENWLTEKVYLHEVREEWRNKDR